MRSGIGRCEWLTPSRSGSLLVIDEADRLRMAGLEQVRNIFDHGGIWLVLIGMPGIEKLWHATSSFTPYRLRPRVPAFSRQGGSRIFGLALGATRRPPSAAAVGAATSAG